MNKINKLIKTFCSNKYGMLIVVSWILLIVCLIIKLFGGNWFELSSENSKFIKFCTFVDKTMWLKMILACIIYLLTTYPIICIILNKKHLDKKLLYIFIPLMIIKSFLSWYNIMISSLIDIVITFFIPYIINKNWKRPILSIVLILLFQMITLFFRNVKGDFTLENSFVIQTIYQIDYYLMIALFYLYNFKRKEIR